MKRYKLYRKEDIINFLDIFESAYPDEDYIDAMECYGKKDKIYCLFDNDEMIGFGAYQITSEETAWISIITIKESHRGKGLGKKIVNYLLNKLKKKSVKTISLDTDIKEFYEPFGFVLYKDWGENCGTTRYSMDLKL